MRINILRNLAAATLVAAVGCSKPAAKPMFTKEEQQQKFVEETAPERKQLEDMEKKFGKDHPQVKQMRLELGLEGGANGPGGGDAGAGS